MTAAVPERPYRGVRAADRLAERRERLLGAGLDLLGAQELTELTVRGVCSRAGVASRYFYESFADKDEFVAAVFDWVVDDLAASIQAAVAAAPYAEQTRAGMAHLVAATHSENVVSRLGTFHRPRRSNELRIASSSVEGAGLQSPPRCGHTEEPGRSARSPSSSS